MTPDRFTPRLAARTRRAVQEALAFARLSHLEDPARYAGVDPKIWKRWHDPSLPLLPADFRRATDAAAALRFVARQNLFSQIAKKPLACPHCGRVI